MGLVFDTTALTRLLDADEAVMRAVAAEEHGSERLVPLAADAEIRYGFNNGSRREQNEYKYQMLFESFNLALILPDQVTARIYADLATWCRQHGVAPSNNDLWIAAASVQQGAKLLTLDRDFSRLPQLRLVRVS